MFLSATGLSWVRDDPTPPSNPSNPSLCCCRGKNTMNMNSKTASQLALTRKDPQQRSSPLSLRAKDTESPAATRTALKSSSSSPCTNIGFVSKVSDSTPGMDVIRPSAALSLMLQRARSDQSLFREVDVSLLTPRTKLFLPHRQPACACHHIPESRCLSPSPFPSFRSSLRTECADEVERFRPTPWAF